MSHKCVAATEYICGLYKLSENCHPFRSVIDSMGSQASQDFMTYK
jgi:hypothetical protein